MVVIVCFTSPTVVAQTIESLVMPGDLIRGHAELESECASCHKPFDRAEQKALCLACHEDVAEDLVAGGGFHGKSVDVASKQCALCHVDHEGRSADITKLDEETFDHLLTNFELLGKHAEADCEGCHEANSKHRDALQACESCHIEDDVHEGNLGSDCGDCHKPNDWTDAEFDHSISSFALEGKHVEVECLSCHADQTHQNTPTTCFGCHAEDDAHEGRSGEQCDTCHNPGSWTDASFDHGRNTDFALAGGHAELGCGDCHSEDPFGDVMDMSCVSCHLEDDEHDGHYGPECESCHTNSAWEDSTFDHARSSDFSLNGSHATITCVDCHVEPVFDAAPGNECSSCHREDDVHEGTLGEQCANCHDESEWLTVPFFDHDLSSFPLLGEHDNIECTDCHESRVFTDTDAECVGCHLEDDSHDGVFDTNCGACHNPVAWDLWLFDHNVQTNFEIDGAHVDVACDSCHRSSLASMRKTGDRCADCHRSDDVHDGEFGPDCERCHSDSSFKDVRTLQ